MNGTDSYGTISFRAELEQCHVEIYHMGKNKNKNKPNLSKWQYIFLQRRDQMSFIFSFIH